ncbi:MAG TPA: hypothetical protein VN066_07100 [Rhodocyclaceae bacterium]|nr:hypothetical protein [Rhodocyclaceae bacterium]
MGNALGIRCIKLAALYAMLGICIGIGMAASHDFSQKTLHAHANLTGWASLALMGLIYLALPALTRSKLALVHFWLHNLGLPAMLFGVFLIYSGNIETGEPFAKIGSAAVGLGFLCFALNVWRNAGAGKAG